MTWASRKAAGRVCQEGGAVPCTVPITTTTESHENNIIIICVKVFALLLHDIKQNMTRYGIYRPERLMVVSSLLCQWRFSLFTDEESAVSYRIKYKHIAS